MVLVFTVTVDAVVDGFLIGLCAVSDATTGEQGSEMSTFVRIGVKFKRDYLSTDK